MAAGAALLDPPAAPQLDQSSLISASVRAESLQALCQSACRLHDIETVVSGRLPREAVIYVSNHLGYLDPIVICGLVPCAPIAKLEVASWPLVGALTRHANVIFVRRGDAYSGAHALRLATRRLAAGISVLNFPEGTTTRGEMLSFQRGVFGIAKRLGVAVVPLAISFERPELCWVDDDSVVSHYARTMFGKAHRVYVDVGPRLYVRALETPAELAERARAWIVASRSRALRRSTVPFPRRPRAPYDHAA